MLRRFGGARRLRFSGRVMFYLLAAYLIMAVLFGCLYFVNSRRSTERRVVAEIARSLDRTHASVEGLIREVETAYIDLLFEDQLYDLLTDAAADRIRLPQLATKAQPILHQAMRNLDDIDSIQIFNDNYVLYTQNTSLASVLNIGASAIYQRARSNARASWTPLYDFVEEYGHTRLADRSLPIVNRNLVSFAGPFNAFKVQNNVLTIWPSQLEKPVVLFNISEETLRGLLEGATGSRDGACFIVDQDGAFITHSDSGKLFSALDAKVFEELCAQPADSGMINGVVDGRDCMVQYARLSNGWMLCGALSRREIYADITAVIFPTMMGMLLTALALSVVLAALVSHHLSRPLRQLMQVIDITGRGNFNVNLARSGDEFDDVKNAFNRMAHRIDALIHENYEAKLSERENELRALKYQTKPHFLYNALTIIRTQALKNGDTQTAQMIQQLSNVMRYVLRGDQKLATVRDEIINVVDYVELMRVGYENAFTLEVDVEPGALNAAICKMTLQPLVENSVQHGLAARGKGGVLRITGRIVGPNLSLVVADNGAGWPENFHMTEQEHATESIGLTNVRRRMKLIFGEECQFRLFTPPEGGAAVELVFPYRFGAAGHGEIEKKCN